MSTLNVWCFLSDVNKSLIIFISTAKTIIHVHAIEKVNIWLIFGFNINNKCVKNTDTVLYGCSDKSLSTNKSAGQHQLWFFYYSRTGLRVRFLPLPHVCVDCALWVPSGFLKTFVVGWPASLKLSRVLCDHLAPCTVCLMCNQQKKVFSSSHFAMEIYII